MAILILGLCFFNACIVHLRFLTVTNCEICNYINFSAIGNAQFIVTVVSSPLGDGSNRFPVSSALNLTCVITPAPATNAMVMYQWIENCDAIPPCFVVGKTTATVGTARLKAEDSGSYQCRPTINGVSIFSNNELTVRVTGKANICAYNIM